MRPVAYRADRDVLRRVRMGLVGAVTSGQRILMATFANLRAIVGDGPGPGRGDGREVARKMAWKVPREVARGMSAGKRGAEGRWRRA
ncbi:hypothetical protein SAMN05216345_109179 [Cupriavidus sp. YR651]|nr:hypothetical protein SAMN05216345_109179 [Cupriavidus sp. YR651]